MSHSTISVENLEALKVQLICHEGLTTIPTKNGLGELTIGVGRNLYHKGISEDEAERMLARDLDELHKEVSDNLPIFNQLGELRKLVLLNMAFSLGVEGLKSQKKLIAALCVQDFTVAANEILRSNWIPDCPDRKEELSMMMKAG
ncbi:glycoside hydrolase family protein [Pseudoalteromonas luteoviolacea]|uniref:glycoside hydrolase family protein n=1 Tax=Pseudoalteromonas luteoviolacea TaxID=43657 RepID=UPI00114F1F3B|nr:lysozyme [Pseudoalteromonas luteoviolacea]TQF70973.1 lysozyme [Pseudoalteromonas luteoviolacea]